MEYKINEYNTPIEELNLDKQPTEVREQFFDFLGGVPYIRSLISPKRLRAKDLPRDKEGKIIVDLEHPHILENMDYFTKAAKTFQKTGKYTELRPNSNPNSEYFKWAVEEARRCREGLVRPSDGEWITGDYYYFLNYCPMSVAKKKTSKGKMASRVVDFPDVWDGHYLAFHYYEQARQAGMHCVELSRRGSGKSYRGASRLAKRFNLGESKEVNKKVTCYVTAQEKKYLVAGDQTLDKFQFDIDFASDNIPFTPNDRLINTIQNMQWTMGYQLNGSDVKKGTLNSVIGITAKDDEAKLRGTRGVLYMIEEGGSMPRLLQLWNNLLPSVEDGSNVFGQLMVVGTTGDNQSDFYAMSEMMYHPDGYHVYKLNNVYDLEGKGGRWFSYFFPGYMNRANCYDKNGNSDVTKALYEILLDRYLMKKNSSDINAVVKRTAEIPIVPQEAIIQTKGNFFPVALIRERINQLENNPNEYNDVASGKLVMSPNGEVTFKPTNDEAIRQFPLKNNNAKGALEIFKMPEKDSSGRVFSDRYVIGHDPVNQDEADSLSLSSTFVLDLYTESIAAEWTGRFDLQSDSFEQLRLLAIFYNAEILYESNNKMCYSYFSQMNCTYMLADTPEYLRERDIVKKQGYGNTAKGVSATAILNKHEDELLKDWLLMPKTIIEKTNENKEVETTIPNVMTIRNLALLKELAQYNPQFGNYDRCRALGVTMIIRNSMVVKYGGDVQSAQENSDEYTFSNDDFFKRNGLIT